MSTLIYAPAIRVHVESDSKGTLDISDDITVWNLHRASNAVSTFNFTLQNTQRKYDGVFKPGDRLTVQLKRITWVPVFTGSLNSVPVFSAWPRALPLSASCSLKKLQFWPWNPSTTASQAMIQNFYASGQASTTNANGDGGLSGLIKTSLINVTGWDQNAIHIGQVPNDWFSWLQSTEQAINAASTMEAVLGPGISSGTSLNGTALNPGAGNYGGTSLSSTQTGVAAAIYSTVITNSGLTSSADQDRAALLCIMCAMQESSLNPTLPGPDTSLGLYQQRDFWGTAAEREDIAWSTKAFLVGANGNGHGGALGQSNWRTGDPATVIQTVQGSAYPDAYAKWYAMAQTLVSKLRASLASATAASGASTGSTPANQGIPTGAPPAASTGTNVAQVAYDLITSRPPGTIKYSQVRPTDPTTQNPTLLDCSSLVDWVYYHATGHILNATNAADEQAICTPISMQWAPFIQGALMFVGPPTDNPTGHVGISLGDGVNHVAAHMAYSDPTKDVNISPIAGNGFNAAGLLPGVDYSNAATNAGAAAYLTSVLKRNATVTTVKIDSAGVGNDPSVTSSGSSTSSVLDQIVTVLASPPATFNGDIFGGPRELIANQPFLPWLKNLTNSSMRSFCSAPNGDFIAWFPDYFGIWGTAGIMNIEPIELQDFTVEWSDQQIVTHEFVIGTNMPQLDSNSGLVSAGSADTYQGLTALLTTQGIATMDFPQLFKAIYGKQGVSQEFISTYLQRFGARPNVDQMGNVFAGQGEFFMAVWNFMYYWASQFSANVPLTFMPELYPGMLLRIPQFGFQAYVTDVVHQGSYGDNGGFTTQATIVAPAALASDSKGGVTVNPSLFNLLPTGGQSAVPIATAK